MTDGTTTAAFDYNADGLRIRKTVGSTVTEYTLHGKNIVHLTRGSASLHFFYDAQNKPSVVDYNGTKYAYVHSLQGDIIGILNASGTEVVRYAYDAWGRQLSKTGSMASTLGTYNPFRYRGYAYDEETGLYYLRSRYYNQGWGRFINADIQLGKVGAILSHNMFSYCINNPVNRDDPAGLTSISPFERDESPWFYSDVLSLSQADMILANNGYGNDDVTVNRKPTGGEGELYVPTLDSTFMVHWSSIGTYHLDVFPKSEGRAAIMKHFGFTAKNPGSMKEWSSKLAWDPVEAYLEFNGDIVAGSVNLMLHSGSGSNAVLNVRSGNICFYTYDSRTSNRVIKPLIQRHRDAAVKAYEFAKSMWYKDWLVTDR